MCGFSQKNPSRNFFDFLLRWRLETEFQELLGQIEAYLQPQVMKHVRPMERRGPSRTMEKKLVIWGEKNTLEVITILGKSEFLRTFFFIKPSLKWKYVTVLQATPTDNLRYMFEMFEYQLSASKCWFQTFVTSQFEHDVPFDFDIHIYIQINMCCLITFFLLKQSHIAYTHIIANVHEK